MRESGGLGLKYRTLKQGRLIRCSIKSGYRIGRALYLIGLSVPYQSKSDLSIATYGYADTIIGLFTLDITKRIGVVVDPASGV